MNKSLNSNPDAPKSLALSVDGTISLSNLPVAVIVSEVALPRSTSPLRTVFPETSIFALISRSPPNVDIPDTFNRLLVVTPLTLIPCGVVWKTFASS